MEQELLIMSYLATQKSLNENNAKFGFWLNIRIEWPNTNIVVSEFLNLLIRYVLKCITLLPANPALPMVEVAVYL